MGNGEKYTPRHISPAEPCHVTTVACSTQLQGFVPALYVLLTDKSSSISRQPLKGKVQIKITEVNVTIEFK